MNAATPESMETVQKELEETMKLHLEALITNWQHVLKHVTGCLFLNVRKLAVRRIT